MAKYYGNYFVNNGTHMAESMTSDNLSKLIKDLKEAASGQIFQYGTGYIRVNYTDSPHLMRFCFVQHGAEAK